MKKWRTKIDKVESWIAKIDNDGSSRTFFFANKN